MNPFEDNDDEPQAEPTTEKVTDNEPETAPASRLSSMRELLAISAARKAIKNLGGRILVDQGDKIPAHLTALAHGAIVDVDEMPPPPAEPLMDPMTGKSDKSRDPKKAIVARLALRTALISSPVLIDFTAEDFQYTHLMAARDKVLMALHDLGELVPRRIGRFPRGLHIPMPAPQEILEALAHEDVVSAEVVGSEHLADAMGQGYVIETDRPVFVRITMRDGVIEAQSDLGIQVCKRLVVPASMTPDEASHPSSSSQWRVRACVWAILTAAGKSHAGKVPEAPNRPVTPLLVRNRSLYLVRPNADRTTQLLTSARLSMRVMSTTWGATRMRNLVLAFSENDAREIYFLHHDLSRAYFDTSIRDNWFDIDLATEEEQGRFDVVLLRNGDKKGGVSAEKAAEVFAMISRVRS